ncbi:MAG: response regulator [Elusimicrobia bacterium]|nr:response regulator [Elusimicrobiota bacterium]
MAAIGLLAARLEDRETLGGYLGEMGHLAQGAGRLDEALEFARQGAPRLFMLVDGEGADAESLTRELLRAFPLLPVVVALKVRDANRAVALMRVGAAEVVAPPWTREDVKASVSKGMRFQGTSLSPAGAAPARRSVLWYSLAIGVFLAAGLGVASLRRAENNRAAAAARVDQWELPVNHPAGLAFDGKSLWLVEWFTQSFYALSTTDSAVQLVRHLTAETPVAATFTGESMWTVSADGTIVRRMRDAQMTVLSRYRKAAPNSAGLAFDGLYLWTLDARAKVLRKHLVDRDLTVLASYRWRGERPAGLLFDGKTLWTLDAADRRMIRHNLERPDENTEFVALPEYGSGAFIPTGAAWDGSRFWTVGEAKDGKGPARLVRHREEPR